MPIQQTDMLTVLRVPPIPQVATKKKFLYVCMYIRTFFPQSLSFSKQIGLGLPAGAQEA